MQMFKQLSDPVGHFKRHVLGPRAKTQAEMNKNFEGTVSVVNIFLLHQTVTFF